MENENPVYVKLSYEESLVSKRNILSLEMSLLNMMKTIKRYNSLRTKEIEIRSNIYNVIKEIDSSMKKTKKSFPSVKSPIKSKKQEPSTKADGAKPVEENSNDDIESQLRKIQEKLRAIGG